MITTIMGNYILETEEEKGIFEDARNKQGSSQNFLRELGYRGFCTKSYQGTFMKILHGRQSISPEKWRKVLEIYNGK